MSAEQWIVVPNWERFQHYRDRDPVWIKNYVALLADDDYLDLSLAQRGLLQGVWLSYARSRGVLSVSRACRELVGSASDARRVREHLESLNRAGFIEVSASRPLALRYPRDRDRVRGREEEEPLTPRDAGNGIPKNSRAHGTNPRALAANAKVAKHDAMLAETRIASESWKETRTDLLHERLDEIERDYGSRFSDQERDEILDAYLERVLSAK